MKYVTLSDCCLFLSGGTPSKQESRFWNGDVPWFSPKDVKQFELSRAQDCITDFAVETAKSKIIEKGTILVVGRSGVLAHTLPVGVIHQKSSFNQDIKALVPNSGYDSAFIALFLKSQQTSVLRDGVKVGATVHSLKSGYIESLKIPDIRIDDQRRIAGELKAQLAEVETARRAAETQLADFQALENVILRDTFCGDDLGWSISLLGDVGNVAAGVTLGRKPKSRELREVPYMRVANVKDGHLALADVKTIAATEEEVEKWALKKGDILFTEGGDLDKVGRGALWSGEIKKCIHQNHIYRVRFKRAEYLPEFIAFQVRSKYAKDYFVAHAKKTTGIASINQRVLKGFPILSPAIDEQKKIVARLTAQLAEVETARQAAAEQLKEIGLLPQKILSSAFGVAGA